ncbi:MAG: ABC transporter permease [Bacteroidia bacterium]
MHLILLIMLLLIYQNLRQKWLNTLLCLFLLMLATAMMVVTMQIQQQMETQQKQNIADIDLVVGAKGSPLQLVLCNLFHIDYPTGNIPLTEAQRLAHLPAVAKSHFLSLGDAYQSYRIVGCDSTYPSLYQLKMAQGREARQALEAIIGAKVAQETGLRVGDSFQSAHGLEEVSEEKEEHEAHTYQVVGIAAPTNRIADALIFTPLESIWQVHEIEKEDSTKEITALLLTFKGAMGAMTVPRMINEQTQLQAASPAFELARLNELMGNGFALMQQFAYLLWVLSGISIFVFMYLAIQERQYDLAILRVMGASRAYTFHLTWLEALSLATVGSLFGIMLGHFLLYFLSQNLAETWHYPFLWTKLMYEESYCLFLNLGIAFVAALFPAIQAYRIEIAKQLSHK